MRIAAIGTIHGNLPALEAVIDEICIESVDEIVVCGDTLAGPLPAETLSSLQELKILVHFLQGNHDSGVVRILVGEDPGGMPERADKVARWVAGKLSPEQKYLVSSWQTTYGIEMDRWGMLWSVMQRRIVIPMPSPV